MGELRYKKHNSEDRSCSLLLMPSFATQIPTAKFHRRVRLLAKGKAEGKFGVFLRLAVTSGSHFELQLHTDL